MKHVVRGTLLALALTTAGASGADPEGLAPVTARPALQTPVAAHAVLLSIARAGGRLVAVGERGVIVYSDDGGASWTQAAVPVSVTLTAVAFPTPSDGFAVGHSGVILHSSDGGVHWAKQLDGIAAKKLVPSAGVDKPFLSLYFSDARHGLVAGAYGLLFATSDGGATWQARTGAAADPDQRHLYALAGHGRRVFLAGEQGFLARSGDGGRSFKRLRSPYRGSFFTAAVLADGELLVAGMRGHAYVSADGGSTFTQLHSANPVSFDGILKLAGGDVVFTDDAGTLFSWHPGARAVTPLQPGAPPLPMPAGIAQAPDGAFVVVGVAGAVRLNPPSRV